MQATGALSDQMHIDERAKTEMPEAKRPAGPLIVGRAPPPASFTSFWYSETAGQAALSPPS